MTLAIIITSGTVLYGTGTQITNPVVFSQSLQPVLGSSARIIGDLGLFLAGLSSSIATPYMAGMIIARLLHWEKKENAWRTYKFHVTEYSWWNCLCSYTGNGM